MTPRQDNSSGEDSLIARYFRPLASDPGAFGLGDDAAILKAQGDDIVVTTDAIVEGVHFLSDDPADTVARKALRVNLSDLAAGTYTIVLSDGQYIANAVFDNGTLGEGFSDLTGSAFCNLANGGRNCPNTTGAYALDVATSAASVPEPTSSVSTELPALLRTTVPVVCVRRLPDIAPLIVTVPLPVPYIVNGSLTAF